MVGRLLLRPSVFALGIPVVTALTLLSIKPPEVGRSSPSPAHVKPRQIRLPRYFEPNRGQAEAGVQFLSRAGASTFELASDGATLVLPGKRNISLRWKGAAASPRISADEPIIGTTSYFFGSDASKWQTAIPHFPRVRYQGLYDGIDAEFYGNDGDIEFDFIVQPGSDPKTVHLDVAGYDSMSLDAGEILLRAGADSVRLRQPVAYQETASGRHEIGARYRTDLRGTVKLDVDPYDRSLPLVVDPVLVYSTYLGGPGFDPAAAIALDGQDSIYLTGRTSSSSFTTVAGSSWNAGSRSNANEIYVAKLNAAGTALVYLAILGGNGDDLPDDISVRPAAFPSASDIYVTGTTSSTDFPTTAGSFHPGPYATPAFPFAFRLNSTGTGLVYSTYLGENGTGTGIVVDRSDRAYVSMNEGSTATVKVLNAAGSSVVHTYGPHQGLTFNDLALEDTSCVIPCAVYVTGDNSKGGGFDPTPAAYQHWVRGGIEGFVLRLIQNGYDLATLLGGSGDDTGNSIAVNSGYVYVGGKTTSPDFTRFNVGPQTVPGGDSDGFLLRFPTALYAIGPFDTYLGGSGADSINDVRVLGTVAYVTGTTSSQNLPLKNSFQPSYGGGSSDAFVAAFETNSSGGLSFLYSSYFGGPGGDGGLGVAVNGLGEAYFAGNTSSSIIPLVSPLQSSHAGNGDAYLARVAAPGLPFTCSAEAASNVNSRVGGTAELMSDILVRCNNGTLGPPSPVTFEITSYVPITSRILNPVNSASEALLFVQEPVASTFIVQPAGTTVAGANVVQGVQQSASVVTFPNVIISQPGPNASLVLRITNIRLNPAAVSYWENSPIHVAVSATGLGVTIANQPPVLSTLRLPVGISLRSSDGATAVNPPAICAGNNSTVSAATGADVIVRFEELFPSAFRNRSLSITPANPNPAAPVNDQNVFGPFTHTETGFYHSGFPSTNGLNQAGLAQSGTRLMVRFKQVPPGVRIWVTSSHLHSVLLSSGAASPMRALRTESDADGAGPYLHLPPTAGAYSEVPLTNGTGIAVWEVAGTDTSALEWLGFGVAVSVPPNSTVAGQILLEGGLGPNGNTTFPVAPTAASTPRFSFPGPTMPLATVAPCRPAPPPVRIGTYAAGQWQLDMNGNGAFDPGSDRIFFLGWPGATQFTGDWNGDGKTEVGVYSGGYWFLDYDGNGVWDNGVNDKLVAWGWPGVTPFVGDWNGNGKTKIGVYAGGFWFLDYNGDFVWDGSNDKQVGWGWAGVTPFVGDWNGDGKTKLGVYSNGFWFLDYNGNFSWEPLGADRQVGWGWPGVTPVIGDWNGDGRAKIGVYAGGYWYLDYDGNYLWTYPSGDRIWELGWTGTTPVTGDWSGDGRAKAGAFINGYWYLDYNGSGIFEGAGIDRIYSFGKAGDVPVVGRW